jgi:CheY-like chemotaxis protein
VSEPAAAVPSSHPYLLIVDDEPVVLEIAGRMASAAGWSPVMAGSAVRALALLDELDGAVHHVLADLHLAGEDGIAFARALRRRDPGLRIALMTGDAEGADPARLVGDAVDAVLEKPFGIQELDHLFEPACTGRAA